ncbi:MAG: hypothetical protein AB7K09_14300 [Planctomycetota bacterium]
MVDPELNLQRPAEEPSSTSPASARPVDGPMTASGVDDTGEPTMKKRRKKKRKRSAAAAAAAAAGNPAARPAMPPETKLQKAIIWTLTLGVLVLGGVAARIWLFDRPAGAERAALETEFASHGDQFSRLFVECSLELRGLDGLADSQEDLQLFRASIDRAKELMISAEDHYQKAMAYANQWLARYDADTPGHADILANRQRLQDEYNSFLAAANELDRLVKLLASRTAGTNTGENRAAGPG